jgi:hypothetical protein
MVDVDLLFSVLSSQAVHKVIDELLAEVADGLRRILSEDKHLADMAFASNMALESAAINC